MHLNNAGCGESSWINQMRGIRRGILVTRLVEVSSLNYNDKKIKMNESKILRGAYSAGL
jgi:hypothetical protein